MALPDLTPLVRLLPEAIQDKGKAVAGAVLALIPAVLYVIPAVGGSTVWTTVVSALSVVAGGFGVYATPNLLPYTAQHENHGPTQ